MNEKELQYIKENYFEEGLNLGFILEAIEEVLETEDLSKKNKLLREQMEGGVLTLQSIPEISVTELGWTDVRTVGDQEVSGPARNQLLQFTRNIQGTELESKINSLIDFYNNPDSINIEGGSPGQRIANALSYLVFYKTLTKVISNFNAASAGFNFEAFLAVLLEGKQIPANTGTIADFTAGDNTPISLKLYAEKSLKVGGSFVDLVGDLVSPQYAPHDFMQYVVVLKSFEDETSGLDIKGELKFYRFNFTLDNVVNIISKSMDKSVACIQIPNEFIREINADNLEYDYNATLPSQENLPSTEELETQFVELVTRRLLELGFGIEQEHINKFTQVMAWATNDDLFNTVEKGDSDLVVRGQSAMPENSVALKNAVAQSFGEEGFSQGQLQLIRRQAAHATKAINSAFTATKQKDKRRTMLRQPDVFATAQESVAFYNELEDPELKKRALMNTRGVLSTLQFDLNRSQVTNIEVIGGGLPVLPEGQDSVGIGTIMIGAQYVQQVLNKMTEELNQNIFTIFQSVKAIQEGTYAFMAGGLQEDAQAEKAIGASREVESKTQELRPRPGEQLDLDL